MRMRCSFLALLVILTIGPACRTSARQIGPLSEQDIEAIKALGPAADKVALAHDWDAVADLWTDDINLMMPNMPMIKGRADFLAWIKSAGITITEHKIDFVDIDGCGDLAYARGVYAETIIVEGMDNPSTDVGKLLTVLRKQPDGTWKFSHWCVASDLPPGE